MTSDAGRTQVARTLERVALFTGLGWIGAVGLRLMRRPA
jgi:hypothetical protein